MQYLLDTVTIIRFFAKIGKIGKKASQILGENENSFFISTISLMEILYLSEKNKIPIELDKTIKTINSLNNFFIVDLTSEILVTAQRIEFYELHDRMILATANHLGIPIISSDRKFKDLDFVELVWN